ncbi:MAG: hypothetical protein AMJ46_06360 [Latescibacteria bacterium DG_63]|nr:MAG: hypothetical protein AMJ46_06360 [Latescibacteria bacterium DG_63]
MPSPWERPPDSLEMAEALASLQAVRRETVRKEVLENDSMELLASHVLGYEVKPFHLAMIRFQPAEKTRVCSWLQEATGRQRC